MSVVVGRRDLSDRAVTGVHGRGHRQGSYTDRLRLVAENDLPYHASCRFQDYGATYLRDGSSAGSFSSPAPPTSIRRGFHRLQGCPSVENGLRRRPYLDSQTPCTSICGVKAVRKTGFRMTK